MSCLNVLLAIRTFKLSCKVALGFLLPTLPINLLQHLCRAAGAQGRGGGLKKESCKLLSDPMGRCEVYNLPVSTHPPPHFHMQRNYWLCVGGWGS